METDHQELPDNCNKHEPDVNTADQIQQPALDQAVRLERAKIVEELLHNHPQFNHVDLQRPALIVSAFDKPDILRLLRNADADINTPDQVGWSLILYAAKFGSVQAIQILLASGADLHTRDNYGRTPIFVAVEYERDQKILQALVEGGANLMDTSTDTGDGLLHLAVLRAPRVMRFLLQFKEQLDLNQRNFEGCTPLLCAKDEGDIRSLALLVEAGADINLVDSRGETSLHCAIEFETVNFRDLLLSQPEIELNCVSVYLGSPLHSACRRSHLDCVNALLARGADPNLISPSTWDQTPLISALLPSEYVRGDIMSSVENVVRYLVRSGASVGTIVPATFYCPLATACFSGTPSMIDFLLDAGASAGCIDPVSGRLPIHFAAANGMKNFDTILIAFQDNMMTPDAYGKNCLQWAAQYGNAYIVEYILSRLELTSERRQAVEQADCDGWTPLCWAICPLFNHYLDQMGSEHRDRVNTVRILLAHGADPEVKCRRGTKTLKPLELAQMCNAGPEIISLLQERVSPQPDLGAPSILKRGRKYTCSSTICDFCLGNVFGNIYDCSSCPEYHFCTKCYPIASCVHNSDLLHDGQSHVINLRPGIAEYEELKNMVSNDRHTGVERGPNQLSHSEATVWKAYGDELKEMGWNALDPAGF